jgi:outer membrane protein assembly factor BamD (BamD/ComL family)
MGNEDLALAAFGDVVSQYPKSEYLRLAQMELKKSNELK